MVRRLRRPDPQARSRKAAADQIEAAFRVFHAENPHVYRALVRLARQAIDAGQPKLGMKQLFEVLRWEQVVVTRAADFRLNNNYTACYARFIMEKEADLDGIFEIRGDRPTPDAD